MLARYCELRSDVAAGLTVDTSGLRALIVHDRDQLAALMARCQSRGEPFPAGQRLMVFLDGLAAAVDDLDRGDAAAASQAAFAAMREGFGS